MKLKTSLAAAAAVLGLAALVAVSPSTPDPTSETESPPRPASPRSAEAPLPLPPRPGPAELLVRDGRLWERSDADPRTARRATHPVRAKAFDQARRAVVGETIRLRLADRIPEMAATVTNQSEQADGTRITHLHLPGEPSGELILQAHEASGFFLGQLYYEDHPVAYEFTRRDDDRLVARRKLVSDLVCSNVDPDHNCVDHGLPGADDLVVAMGKGGNGNGNGGGSGGGGPGGGGGGSGPTVSILDASIVEGTGAASILYFDIVLSKKNRKNDVTVDFTVSDGTALFGVDYLPGNGNPTGTATIFKGNTATQMVVLIAGDTDVEADETFHITLSNPVNAAIGDGAAVGSIINDDGPPQVSLGNASALEGDSGTSSLTFTVSLDKPATATVTFDYATSDDTATAGVDYAATTGSGTIPLGGLSATFTVDIFGDTDIEPNEVFNLVLSNITGADVADSSGVGSIGNDDLPPLNVPVHNSLPGAGAVAYLDMDGEVVSGTPWNGGYPIVANGVAQTMGPAQLTEIWERVAEDFAPFAINVTTEESVYLAASPASRIRCIITPDNEWFGSAGGVAYIGSFTWTGDTPCWVFSDLLSNNPRYIAEASSHEVGHTVGLRHDGRTSPSEAYYAGHGAGATGWAPIMGVGYYKPLVQWSRGEYANANQLEDDLAIITGQNGFGYRSDDHSDVLGSATPLVRSGTALTGGGIIETDTDVDVFSFTTTGGVVTLQVDGAAPSPNLDLEIRLLDGTGGPLAAANPVDFLDAALSLTLAPGIYHVQVTGVGKGDPQLDGYTGYGSLGQYTLSGNAP